MSKAHDYYMRRALELAKKGISEVAPNPLVGAVIVHNNEIIGEGYHRKYGGPHAEVNAIHSVSDKSKLAESTIYVTLEPCSHFGKTPPCSDLIIKNKIARVIIANKDPFSKVNGSGIERLKKSGIQVIQDVLKEEGQFLNRRFFTFHQKKRPYIILKWAESSDGFISRNQDDPLIKTDNWISSEASKQLVHQWRSEEGGILIGTNTARIDNPKLNTRLVSGKNPIRIVIDKNLSLNKALNIYNKDSETIIFNSLKEEMEENVKSIKIDFNKSKSDIIEQMLDSLFRENMQSLIIEGGSKTLELFLENKIWDEARVFTSDKEFQNGVKAPRFRYTPSNSKTIEGDQLNYYYKS